MFQKEWIAFLGITILSGLLFFLFSFTPEIYQYGDNGGYMSLGIAFAQGHGFIDPALPGRLHALWWPPGFPLFIALFYRIFGPQWILLKVLVLFILYGSFFLYARTIQAIDHRPLKAALILVALCFSSGIHLLSSYLYAETFFTANTLLFFFLWLRWSGRLTLVRVLILALFAGYIASVRLVGIALLLAFQCMMIISDLRSRKKPVYSIVAGMVLIAYVVLFLFVPQLRVDSFRLAVGMHPQYQSTLTGTFQGETATWHSLFSYYISRLFNAFRGFGVTLIPQAIIRSIYDLHDMNWIKALGMGMITMIVFIGWIASMRRNLFFNLYSAWSMIILTLHGPCYVRVLVPLIPFLFLYFYTGLETIVQLMIKNMPLAKSILVLLWCIVIADNATRTFTDPHRTMPPQFGDAQYQQCIDWVGKNVTPNDVVVCQTHSYLYLVRGPYCLPYNYVKTVNEFMAYIDEHRVNYIVVSPVSQRAYDNFMEKTCEAEALYHDSFKKVFGNEGSAPYVLEYHSGSKQ